MAGRPTLLTDELADDLVLLLSAGASPARAARALGVGERSIRRWLSDGLRERVRRARQAGPESTDALSEARLVVLILRAAGSDWRAAAWWLERKHPERWGAGERASGARAT